MVNSSHKLLKSVVDSKSGIHITMYIHYKGDVLDFRAKLGQFLNQAENYLKPILSDEKINKLLNPIRELGEDAETVKKFKGHIAIFRKEEFIRYMSLPIELEESCVVADSFHVKPLLKWTQQDQDFFLIDFKDDSATLYLGSQSEFRRIDTVLFPLPVKFNTSIEESMSFKERQKRSKGLKLTMEWMANWVEEFICHRNITVFVAGKREFVSAFIKKFKSDSLYPESVASDKPDTDVTEVCRSIRSLLRLDARTRMIETLKEFEFAHRLNLAKTNIFQIAKAAIKGNVRKLVIAEDLKIFGKLDLSTGGLSLHPMDMDHEDDCLLDDLAQTVLLKGGEVIVAKRSEIPKGRAILAVLNDKQSDLFLEARVRQEPVA